jgi:hypothetical protein
VYANSRNFVASLSSHLFSDGGWGGGEGREGERGGGVSKVANQPKVRPHYTIHIHTGKQ